MLFYLLNHNYGPLDILFIFVSLFVMIGLHEAAHAYTADRLGDSTPSKNGRLTLNPLAHLDLVGSVLIVISFFGWGRPTPVNPYNFRNPKRDMLIVSLAGPVCNLVIAVLLAIVFRIITVYNNQIFISFLNDLYLVITICLNLAIFNLIPLGPLDGFKVVAGLLPWQLAMDWQQTERFGIFVLLFLMMTPVFGTIVGVPVSFLSHLLLGV